MANAFIPAEIAEGGNGFPAVSQTRVKGGAWSVSAIADWQSEIEPRYRASGMRILDRSDRSEWVLQDDLVSVVETKGSAASDAAEQSANDAAQFAQTADERATAAGVSETNSAESEANSESYKDQAFASLSGSQTYKNDAALLAQQAQDARNATIAATDLSAIAEFIDTDADLSGAGLSANDIVMVWKDNTRGDATTLYQWDGSAFGDPTVWLNSQRLSDRQQMLPYLSKQIIECISAHQAKTYGQSVSYLSLIDSINGEPGYALLPWLSSKIYNKSLDPASGDGVPARASTTGGMAAVEVGAIASTSSDDYAAIFNGNTAVWNVGSWTVRKGGASFDFDTLTLCYIVTAGGGTIEFFRDGVSVGGPYDTSVGTVGAIGFAEAVETDNTRTAELTVVISGGTVKSCATTNGHGLYRLQETDTGNRLYDHNWLAEGGLGIYDAVEFAQSRANTQALVARLAPDIITVNGREQIETVEDAAPLLFDILDAAAPNCDKVVFSGAPIPYGGADEASSIQQANLWRAFTLQRRALNKPYTFIDIRNQFEVDGDPTTALGYFQALPDEWEDGGVHIGPEGMAAFYGPWTRLFSSILPGQGGQSGAPYTREAGWLGIDTQIADISGLGYKFSVIAPYDGRFYLPRSVRFLTNESLGNNDEYFQVGSGGTGSGGRDYKNHVVPLTMSFGTWDGRFSRSESIVNGLHVIEYKDSAADNPADDAIVKFGAVWHDQITLAEANALAGGSINQIRGTVAHINYGTQTGMAVASGGGSGSWRALGRMVSPPNNSGSPGAPGDFAASATEVSFYIGNGDDSHAWSIWKRSAFEPDVSVVDAATPTSAAATYDQAQIDALFDEVEALRDALRATQQKLNADFSKRRSAGQMLSS
ncbi:hypothetical protein [uncultured Martelella sp.]|uniref:hypothetical protein n=1 Tax=uncultured Martelella sp. TaxID=392331 RepID=UPI0029C8EAF1|nr:hypothetical protein [uncultured Martelella sp.]